MREKALKKKRSKSLQARLYGELQQRKRRISGFHKIMLQWRHFWVSNLSKYVFSKSHASTVFTSSCVMHHWWHKSKQIEKKLCISLLTTITIFSEGTVPWWSTGRGGTTALHEHPGLFRQSLASVFIVPQQWVSMVSFYSHQVHF